MKIDNIKKLEELLLGDAGLLIALRLGNGLNIRKADEIIKILETLSNEWADKDYIPKKAAELFIDFYPAMESACGLYSDNESINIMDVADKIVDLIRDCVI
jgi:hypothetical protein